MKFNSPEHELLQAEKDLEFYIHPAIKNAYDLAKRILGEGAINPKNLTQWYGEGNVAADLAYVESRKKDFLETAQKKYADVLEAILHNQIPEWLGPGVRTIKTSPYDDIANGSDLILEFAQAEQETSHLSLSIDVTFGTTTEGGKFKKIKDQIDTGTLGKIKYFHSEKEGRARELINLPQVVIGVEKDLVVQLAGIWVDDHGHKKERNVELAAHPVQRLIFTEILMQLRIFRTYAEETKKKPLVLIYQKDIDILENLLKGKPLVDITKLKQDKVFLAIKEALKIFKSK